MPDSPVHPRGRGEHGHRARLRPAADGSSPRARGTPHPCRPAARPGRFIPAGAGNTAGTRRSAGPAQVHPRGRGEHAFANMEDALMTGSSPRARGTQSRRRPRPDNRRFIPAGAGNTGMHKPGRARKTVHPRGRGEHDRRCVTGPPDFGSSPRARGTRSALCDRAAGFRFIPAGAGNTRSHVQVRAHLDGSSPRARGTLSVEDWRDMPRRFIPAGAGNTSRR